MDTRLTNTPFEISAKPRKNFDIREIFKKKEAITECPPPYFFKKPTEKGYP
jgi:hypothetical protein